MNIRGQSIEVRGVPIDIVRKDIKNLHLGVYPPNGRVRVAAPVRLSNEAVRLAVISRLGWIRRQQAKFERQDRQSRREMVNGETHYVQGRRYLLSVVEANAAPTVRLRSNTRLELGVRPGSDRQQREDALHRWYRALLGDQLAQLIAKWEPRIGVAVPDYGIRKMKTRWGTCNPRTRRIRINLELAKKSPPCLEYILVHEMIHLLERQHNERFRQYMDRLLPKWRMHRQELNQAPLGHADWTY